VGDEVGRGDRGRCRNRKEGGWAGLYTRRTQGGVQDSTQRSRRRGELVYGVGATARIVLPVTRFTTDIMKLNPVTSSSCRNCPADTVSTGDRSRFPTMNARKLQDFQGKGETVAKAEPVQQPVATVNDRDHEQTVNIIRNTSPVIGFPRGQVGRSLLKLCAFTTDTNANTNPLPAVWP
jgi:hypothetical protein